MHLSLFLFKSSEGTPQMAIFISSAPGGLRAPQILYLDDHLFGLTKGGLQLTRPI